jgi:ferredoxin--NADP+ reductase
VDEDGRLECRATEHVEDLPIDLVFRSVGYRGVPLAGLPFHERWGLIPNDQGRVTDPAEGSRPVRGMYVSGWIKRGPSGVIGTNKKDGAETAAAMLEDAAAGRVLEPADPDRASLEALVRERQPSLVTYQDWSRLDEIECSRGEECGRPRVKFTSRAAVRSALAGS